MHFLRRVKEDGRTALQTPLIRLSNAKTGAAATLVLTAHMAEPAYFDALRERVRAANAPVYFEGVRAVSDEPDHWHERYHALLRAIREDFYAEVASLGLLAFQGDHLQPEPYWRNADVTCCALAERLRSAGVRTRQYNVALQALRRLVRDAKAGRPEALRSLERLLKWGLVGLSFEFVLRVARLFPNTRRFHAVVNDWRSEVAVETVLRAGEPDFVLLYGAAHGPPILDGLRKAGYRERSREWVTLFRV